MTTLNTCQCSQPGLCPVFDRQMGQHSHSICGGTSGHTVKEQTRFKENWTKLLRHSQGKAAGLTDELLAAEITIEQVETANAISGKLIGDIIAEWTSAVGIPPCKSCAQRKEWLNKSHQIVLNYIRNLTTP